MLELYHVAGSSNSQRVRIVLDEKGIDWVDHELTSSAQLHTPQFRAVSPAGTVPALVHNGQALTDSVVINEYLEDFFPSPSLRPTTALATALMRQWTKHADDYWQRSIAVFTHALAQREKVLAAHGGDLDAALAPITDPIILSWRRSVYSEGLASAHAQEAMRLILASLAKLDRALQEEEWLVDGRFTLAEVALLPALFRLDCLAMEFLWEEDYPAVGRWLARGTARASFQRAVLGYLSAETLAQYRTAGEDAGAALQRLARIAASA